MCFFSFSLHFLFLSLTPDQIPSKNPLPAIISPISFFPLTLRTKVACSASLRPPASHSPSASLRPPASQEEGSTAVACSLGLVACSASLRPPASHSPSASLRPPASQEEGGTAEDSGTGGEFSACLWLFVVQIWLFVVVRLRLPSSDLVVRLRLLTRTPTPLFDALFVSDGVSFGNVYKHIQKLFFSPQNSLSFFCCQFEFISTCKIIPRKIFLLLNY